MKQRRFTIRTFRGYDSFETYGFAMANAQSLIIGIKADGWCDEYWWCEIIDNESGLSRIVTMDSCLQVSFSKWLRLR